TPGWGHQRVDVLDTCRPKTCPRVGTGRRGESRRRWTCRILTGAGETRGPAPNPAPHKAILPLNRYRLTMSGGRREIRCRPRRDPLHGLGRVRRERCVWCRTLLRIARE